MAETSPSVLEFVDVLRTLKRAINEGGKLYSAPITTHLGSAEWH